MAGDGGNGPPRLTAGLHDIVFVEGRAEVFSFPPPGFDDPDGDTVRLIWEVRAIGTGASPGWLTTSPTALVLSGTAPPGSPDYEVRVTPTDGQANGTTERFTLRTESGGAGNRAPVATLSLSDQTWTEGVPGSYVLPASAFADPDGDTLTLAARLGSGAPLPAWLAFDPGTRTLAGSPPSGSDNVALRFTASDPGGASAGLDLLLVTSATPLAAISGTAGPDSLEGSTGADVINALAGDDIVNANGGDDAIDGGAGADRLNGGSGSDTAVYAGTRGDYLLSRNSGGVVTVSDRFGEMDTLTDIETLQFGGERVATSSLAYAPAVSLSGAGVGSAVYRFYNVRDRAYFYTDSAAEKDLVVRESTDAAYTPANGVWPYFYQGSTFGAASGSGAVPVYRFYNTSTGHHFFTVSAAERDLVRRESTDPSYTPENGLWPFRDEGVGFLALADGSRANSVPVFRFFSPSLNRHFFTASTDEAQQMRLTGQWTDEGIGFYGTPLAANSSPALAAALPDQRWTAGRSGSYQVPSTAFTDADGDTLVYSAATTSGSALPAWLSFDTASRTFTGTPQAGGADVAVRVTVSDGRGGSASDDFVIGTAADLADNSSTSGLLEPGVPVSGTVDSAGDRDWYRIPLTGGRQYVIDLQGTEEGHGTLVDPYIAGVYNAGGSKVTGTQANDVGSKNKDAQLKFIPGSTGDYFISAGAFDNGTGTYRLTVLPLEDSDYTSDTSTLGRVAVGGIAVGWGGGDDRDWFRVALVAGQAYTIDLEGSGNDAGTMGDPKLTLFGYNALGSKWVSLAANDNISSKNANARLNFIPGYTGDYYLEATGATYGTYRLSVTADRTGQSEDGPERALTLDAGGGGPAALAAPAPDAFSHGHEPAAPVVLDGLPADDAPAWLALAPVVGLP